MDFENIATIITGIGAVGAALISALNRTGIMKSRKQQSSKIDEINKNQDKKINSLRDTIDKFTVTIVNMNNTLEDVKRQTNKEKYINYIIDSVGTELNEIIELKREYISNSLEKYLQTITDTINDMTRYIIISDILYEERQPFSRAKYKRKYNTLVDRRNYLTELSESIDEIELVKIQKIIDNLQDNYILELQSIRKGTYGDNGQRIERLKEITVTLIRDTVVSVINECPETKNK